MATSRTTDRAAAKLQLAAVDEEVKSGTVVTDVKKGDDGEPDNRLRVKLRNEEFLVDDELGTMAMLEWAAASDLSIDDNAGLAAVHAMLEDVIHPDDWAEFRHYARTARPKISADELIKVINDAAELISGRPTEPASGS
jgi:L-alanine-DL-glutamate epimerase-like enolase superfamily enzyme